MSFQWLQMRISEEADRRKREADIIERLPRVLEEVHQALVLCAQNYAQAFGPQSIELNFQNQMIRVTVREMFAGKWLGSGKVEVTAIPKPLGLHIDRNGDPLDIEVGLLPGDRIFYKDGDKFLTIDELTRRILDRVMFPKLAAES